MELRRPKPADREFAHRLKTRRLEVGMSQQQLAALIGLSFQQIQKYENGKNRVAVSTALEMAGAMETTLEEIVKGLEAWALPKSGTKNRRKRG